MDATSRRICLGGVLKTDSCPTPTSFFLFFLFSLPLPSISFYSSHTYSDIVVAASLLPFMALVNDIDRHCLTRSPPLPRVETREDFSQRPTPPPPLLYTFVSVSRFSTSFPSLERRNVWSGSWNGCAEKWRLPRRKLLLAPFNFEQIGSGGSGHKGPDSFESRIARAKRGGYILSSLGGKTRIKESREKKVDRRTARVGFAGGG